MRVEFEAFGVKVPVASLSDIIRSKEAARPLRRGSKSLSGVGI